MPWPLSQDYNEAIQNPAQSFADNELRQGEAVTNEMGLPRPCSGNFADVYALQCGQRKWAVKCFTRQIPGLKDRYAEISKYLRKTQLPFTVEFQFLEQGIRVHGQWYPILKMQWVEGLTLNTFVRTHADSPQNLNTLCQIWVKLASRMREANLAHCDLQHGNVLLVPGSQAGVLSVRLVDYDGMCVPALELLKTIELGHPAYQHPQRLREATYGLEIDRFSHLVIYTALRSVIVGGQALWQKFDTGDNLLFTQKDFESPHKSRLFAELLRLQDPMVGTLTRALIEAARKPVDQAPMLESLLPAPPPTQIKATAKVPVSGKVRAPASDDRPLVVTDFRRKKGSLTGPLVVAAVLLLLIGSAGAYWLMRSSSTSSEVAARSEPAPPRASRLEPLPQTSRPHAEPTSPKPKEAEPKPKPEPKLEPKPEPKPDPKPEPKLEPKPEPEAKPVKDKRAPVPDEASRVKAEKLIREVFKDDYAKTRPEDMRALATKLLQQAPDTRDDAAARYVLFTDGARLAAQAGAWEAAWKGIDDLAGDFAVNSFEAKLATLESVRSLAKGPDDHKAFVEATLPLIHKAVAADEVDRAALFAKLAEAAAKETQSLPLVSLVQARMKRLDNIRKQFDEFKQSTAALAQNPKNPDAQLTVGKYLCFVKGDWERGLSNLGQGSDAKLAALAKKDLAGSDPANAPVEIGDGWWDLAEADQGSKTELQKRACYWYRKAESGLTGLTLTRVQKRLDLAAKQDPETSAPSSLTEASQFKGHTEKVTGVVFTKNGESIISGSEDQTARRWDMKTGKESAQFIGVQGPLVALAISPDGARLSAISATITHLWDVQSTKPIHRFNHSIAFGTLPDDKHAATTVKSLAFIAQDGSKVAVGNTSGVIFRFLFESATTINFRFGGKTNSAVNGLACAKDGVLAVAACADGTVRLFDFEKRQETRQLAGHAGEVLAVAISPDGLALVSAGADKTIRLWNATTGQLTRVLKGHAGPVTCLAILPDGRILSGSDDKTVRMWDAKTGREMRTFKGHTEAVTCVAVSPNGKAAVSGSNDRTLRLWDLTK